MFTNKDGMGRPRCSGIFVHLLFQTNSYDEATKMSSAGKFPSFILVLFLFLCYSHLCSSSNVNETQSCIYTLCPPQIHDPQGIQILSRNPVSIAINHFVYFIDVLENASDPFSMENRIVLCTAKLIRVSVKPH